MPMTNKIPFVNMQNWDILVLIIFKTIKIPFVYYKNHNMIFDLGIIKKYVYICLYVFINDN